MPLEIEILKHLAEPNRGSVTVKLQGHLDSDSAPKLEGRLEPILAGLTADLVFDLAELKFISSAGLRVFALAQKRLRERKGQASFVNLQPQIREVFEIIKALPGIRIFRDTTELDEYLAIRQRTHGSQS